MHNRKWVGDRLWYLLYLDSATLKLVFPNNWDSLKSKRKLYRKKIKNGEIMPPRKPETYSEGQPPERIKENLRGLGETAISQLIDEQTREQLHKRLDEVIDQTNINPAHVKGFRVSSWDGMIKDADGEIQTKKLQGIQLVAEAKDFEPLWPPIRQIDYQPVPFLHREQKKRPVNQGCAVILPDPQIGYRRYADGEIDPFHDERAISIALSIMKEVRPTEVIWLGDFLDLPAFGRYEQSEDYAHTTNLALQYAARLLDTIRSIIGPKAQITVLEGNHERRIEKSNNKNMLANFNLRQEGDVSSFPVLSVPHLLNFEKRGIKYIEGYPAGKYWVNEKLQIIHGHIVRSGGSTAAAVAKTEDASTIFGHVHRIEQHYQTQTTYKGHRTNAGYSPGCLCRIDGAVPSAKGSTRLDGRPVSSAENWQQGLAVVEFERGDGPFAYEQIYINTAENYRTVYRGRIYEPKL